MEIEKTVLDLIPVCLVSIRVLINEMFRISGFCFLYVFTYRKLLLLSQFLLCLYKLSFLGREIGSVAFDLIVYKYAPFCFN